MRVDAPLVATGLPDVPAVARGIEADGFDGTYTFEGPHDPFLPLALAAEHTERIDLMTAVAIAFARSPMQLAHLAWDLQAVSGGRMILGLGSQIRPHIERRFSMEWSAPAARMREYVEALRAVFSCWQDGVPLRFEGRHYRHTLTTPFFTPDPLASGPPRVFLAGVGPAMTAVAADVADGLMVHPFTTVPYLETATLPRLRAGARGRDAAFGIAWPVMVATGPDDAAREAAEFATRAQIAFYASTPAYRPVLDHHDRGDLQPELRDLTRSADWSAMAARVDDELFDLVAVRGTPEECGTELARRTTGLVDRVGLNAPYAASAATWQAVLKAFRVEADTMAGSSPTTSADP